MFFCLVVALVAGVDLLAAAESEPAVGFPVVSTETVFGKRRAWHETEGFFLFAREDVVRGSSGGDLEELYRGDGEGEFLVAFATDVGRGLAADGDYSWGGVGGGTGGAGGCEGTGLNVNRCMIDI
jgi:hypothetical protein